MLHRETGNAAAITGYRGGLEPGSAMNLFQALGSGSDEYQADPIEVKKTKVKGNQDYTADTQPPRQKESKSKKSPINKNDNLRSDSDMLKASSKQNNLNKSDIFLSKDVLERLAAHNGDKVTPTKRTTKNADKSETMGTKNKTATAQNPDTPVTQTTKAIVKKRAPKAAVRPSTLNNPSVSKESESISITPKIQIVPGNELSGFSGKQIKASEPITDQLLTQCPTTFSLDVPTTVEITVKDAPDATLCGVCSQKNCQSDVCKSLNDIIDATCKKDFKFSRDSSEDSGCYSNLSRQSTNMEPAGGLEVVKEDNAARSHEVNEADVIKTSTTQCGTCGSCKSDMPTRENGLCKNCWNKIKKESGRIGTLDEFRAYAKSIAQSVKRILDIRPKKTKEDPIIDNKVLEQNKTKQEAITEAKKGKTEGVLHRFKTEIPLIHPTDPRAKSYLNRSASYDGKILLVPEEHFGLDLMDISSTTTVSMDLKTGSDNLCYNIPSMDDREMLRMEKYLEIRKKKLFRAKALRGEESSSSLILSRSDEKTKMLAPNIRHSKIRKSVERAGTDGDLRPNVLGPKNAKRQGKEMEVKQMQEPYTDIVEFGKRLHKSDKDNKNALRMSMMKVIKEGTPVDPPESGEKKARKTALSRSATVPYKIYAVKKDSIVKDKSAKKSDSVLKSTRSSTKIMMRTNKASSLRKENSIKGKEKSSSLPIGPLELWRGEHKITQKGRSTSYDGSFLMYAKKRTDVVRSRSRSTILEDEETKTLNAALLKSKRSNESDYTPSVAVIPEMSAKTKNVMAYKASEQVYSGAILGQALKEKDVNVVEPLVAAHPTAKTVMAVDESYCDGVKHLPYALECQLTAKKQTSEKSESYYRDKVSTSLSKVSELSNEVEDDFSKTEIEETKSEKTADVYTAGKLANTYDSTSYYEGQESALSKRDRSHESKSSTSFHLITSVKGSHSDVALMRSQGMPDYATYRRQSGNPESDVDTGVIYHFAKRQTTRAHIPLYHDLTAGKALYTMSGDVSSSESSFSGTSVKSEVSDNMYTGGFYKDPFYEQENNGDSSSASSSSHLYFEPNEVTSKQEQSEHDLYTGGVFSSNQNAISLNYQTSSDHRVSSDFSKNGSTNNSTRPTLNRLSRRQRTRPRIDFVMDYNIEALGYNQGSAMTPCVGGDAKDWSNNSNNGQTYKMTTLNEETSRPTITLTDDSAYTDYVRNHRPKPPTSSRSEHPFQRGFDFSKYEIQEAANTGFFFQTPKKPVHEDIWYRGPYVQPFTVANHHERTAEYQNMVRFQQNQEEDDNYTNIICPKYRNNNNSNDSEDANVNNNHLEHFYTGDYSNEPPEARAPPQAPEPIYEDLPSKYSSPFYLNSGVTTPQPPPPQMFSPPDMTYSSAGTYGGNHDSYMGTYSQGDTGYSQGLSGYSSASNHYGQSRSDKMSSSYTRTNQEDSPWTGYEQAHTPLLQGKRLGRASDYDELPSQRYGVPQNQQEERDSYFDYAASRHPSASQYVESSLGSPFSPFGSSKSPTAVPVVNEIKKVGGIVCRENVVNKEDYAEDVNRDLMDEPGAWVSFKYRAEEDCRNLKEMAGARNLKSEVFGASDTANAISKLAKTNEESPYAHNHVYDNQGARNNWREMNQDHGAKWRDSREATKQKPVAKPDSKKDHSNKTTWRPSDQIPERAMGKRPQPPAKRPVSPTILDGNNNTSLPGTGHTPPKTPSKNNRIQYSISSCVKCDSPKPKWIYSVEDHPHPRARNKAKETPKIEALYISNVVQIDEMMFIRARKLSGDSDRREFQLDLIGNRSEEEGKEAQISEIPKQDQYNIHPLIPLHCLPKPTWILLDTPNLKPKEVKTIDGTPSAEKSGKKSIVASPKIKSPVKTNSYKTEEYNSTPTSEEIGGHQDYEKQAGETAKGYDDDNLDDTQAAETPNTIEYDLKGDVQTSEISKEIEDDKVDDEQASETPREDDIKISVTPKKTEGDNEKKADETPDKSEDEKYFNETPEKMTVVESKTYKIDEAKLSSNSDPFEHLETPQDLTDQMSKFEINPQNIFIPEIKETRSSNGSDSKKPIGKQSESEVVSNKDRKIKEAIAPNASVVIDLKTPSGIVKKQTEFSAVAIKRKMIKEAVHQINIGKSRTSPEQEEFALEERDQQKYFMMTTILMKKKTIQMTRRKREPRL